MKKTLLLFLILFTTFTVAEAQVDTARIYKIIALSDSMNAADSAVVLGYERGERQTISAEIAERFDRFDGLQWRIDWFEQQYGTNTNWSKIVSEMKAYGLVLGCGSVGNIGDSDNVMFDFFVYKIIKETEVDLNDHIYGEDEPINGDSRDTFYTVVPIIQLYQLRNIRVQGIAITTGGQKNAFLFQGYDQIPEAAVPFFFFRYVVQEGLWKSESVFPSAREQYRDGSLYWLAEDLELEDKWKEIKNNLAEAQATYYRENELAHVIADRKDKGDGSERVGDEDSAGEAMSDAASLYWTQETGHTEFLFMTILGYIRRTTEYAGYSTTQKISVEILDSVLVEMPVKLSNLGKNDLAKQAKDYFDSGQANMRNSMAWLYYLLDDETFMSVIIKPFCNMFDTQARAESLKFKK